MWLREDGLVPNSPPERDPVMREQTGLDQVIHIDQQVYQYRLTVRRVR